MYACKVCAWPAWFCRCSQPGLSSSAFSVIGSDFVHMFACRYQLILQTCECAVCQHGLSNVSVNPQVGATLCVGCSAFLVQYGGTPSVYPSCINVWQSGVSEALVVTS